MSNMSGEYRPSLGKRGQPQTQHDHQSSSGNVRSAAGSTSVSIGKGETSANYLVGSVAEGARCPIHVNEKLSQYCRVCMVAVCRDCIIGDHRNHSFEDLGNAVGKMIEEVKVAAEASGSFLPKLENAERVLKEKDEGMQLLETANALKKEINMAADSALAFVSDEIDRQRNTLLATAEALAAASNGTLMSKITQDASTTLNLARAVIDSPEKKNLTDVNIANIYPELMRKLGTIVSSSLEGGLLDSIPGMRVPTFSPNTSLVKRVNIGRLNHPTTWRLVKTLSVPPNRVAETTSIRTTSDGKLAIGYKNGGIDIFSPLTPGDCKTILRDVKIYDFAFMRDNSVAVVTLGRKLFLFDLNGIKLDVTFNTPMTSGLMSVAVDDEGCLIVGFAEHKSIHVYSPRGGDPTKIIDLEGFDPWRVTSTTMGRIITKNLNSVRVYDRSGAVKATIVETPPLCTLATADKTGAIFTVVLRKPQKISVAKHRIDGSFEETIMKEQTVYKIENNRYWFDLTVISKDCLAVTDTLNVFIYRNAPVLPDLMKLAK